MRAYRTEDYATMLDQFWPKTYGNLTLQIHGPALRHLVAALNTIPLVDAQGREITFSTHPVHKAGDWQKETEWELSCIYTTRKGKD